MSFWGVLLVSLTVAIIIVAVAAYFDRHVAVKSLYLRSDDGRGVTLTGRGLMFTNDEAQVTCELRPDGLYVYGPAVVLDPAIPNSTAQRIPSAPRIRLIARNDGEAGLWLHRGVVFQGHTGDETVAKEFTTASHLQAVDGRQQDLFERFAIPIRKIEEA
jgi:hypothetical protein